METTHTAPEASKVRFLDHYVTDGAVKARVSYSIGTKRYAPGGGVIDQPHVTLYAKCFDDGRALGTLLNDEYENHTDSQSDYFDKGHATIFEGHPLYAAALERAQAVKAKDAARWAATLARRDAKRTAARGFAKTVSL